MTNEASTAGALRTRARPRTQVSSRASALLRSEVAPPVALAAFCALLIALTWGTWGDLGMDTGYDLLAGARVADGELPYVDYVYYYGPLAPALLGSLFALFGASVDTAIAVGLAVALGTVAATYALGRELSDRLGALLAGALAATALFSTGNSSGVLPHTFSASIGVLLALLVLLCLAHHARTGGRAPLVLAGSAAGLVAFTRPELVLAVWGGVAAWVLARALTLRGRGWLGELAAVAAPALALPLLAYGALITQVPPRELLTENLFPVGQLGEAGESILRAAAPLTAGSFAELVSELLLYGAGVAALVAAGLAIGRSGRLGRAVPVLAVLAGVAFVGALAVNPDGVRNVLAHAYAWIPAGAALALVVVAWRLARRAGASDPQAMVVLAGVVMLALLAAPTYADFAPHATFYYASKSTYAMPLAALFLVWLHLRVAGSAGPGVRALGASWLALLAVAGATLAIKDAGTESVIVRGPHGALADDPSSAPAYQAALDTIARETRAGEPVLLAPQLSTLYVMSGRANPLSHLSLLPGALDAEAEREAIAQMDGVRLAITDRRAYGEYGHGAFGETFDKQIAAWLEREFERTRTIRGAGPDPAVLDVWQRRAAGRAGRNG